MFALSDFREGSEMVEMLACARREGVPFDRAWSDALRSVRRGRRRDNERWMLVRNAFAHHRDAWQRAYERRAPTPLDNAGDLLRRAMETMYDDSGYAEAQ